ncbi:hypothetical protein ABTH91_21250, partial [Acinetobacter baumannii]
KHQEQTANACQENDNCAENSNVLPAQFNAKIKQDSKSDQANPVERWMDLLDRGPFQCRIIYKLVENERVKSNSQQDKKDE